MQKQLTIFGAERELRGPAKRVPKAVDLGLVVQASESLCAPCFVPGADGKKGTWYLSIDGTAFAYGFGTMAGLTGRFRVSGADFITHAIVTNGYSQLLGTALMNGKAIKVFPSAPGTVTVAAFGILSGVGKQITFKRVNGRWEKV